MIRAAAHVVRAKERLAEEGKEDLARARRDDDGSPESKRRIEEATEKVKELE